MNHKELLDTSFDCECGKQHRVPVRKIIYAEDALKAIGSLLGTFTKGRKIVILADQRTWQIAGQAASKSLRQNGWDVNHLIVEDTEHGGPVCDDHTFNCLKDELPPCDIALAVGCGVINDLTKWLTFDRKIPYAVVATAATMNGFTAANIAATLDGVKTIVFARAPLAVFAVPSVIRDAPFELTTAGLGDVIAKPVSTADWLMNHIFLDEYFCPFCSRMITDLEPAYFDHPQDIRDRKPAATEALFNTLLYSGIAMTVVGTSAPASGGEHMLSHTLDMMSSVDNNPHDLHGRQVGVGTILACALYEKILQIDKPQIVALPEEIDTEFWGALASSVQPQYIQKQPLMRTIGNKITDTAIWQRFLDAVKLNVRGPEEIKRCLKTAGAAHTFAQIGCDRNRFRNAALHMHEIRKRPTVVDLAWLLDIFPHSIDEIMDRWLTEID